MKDDVADWHDLILKYLKEDLTAAEQLRVDELYRQSPSFKKLSDEFSDPVLLQSRLLQFDLAMQEWAAVRETERTPVAPVRTMNRRSRWIWAAAAISAASIVMYMYLVNPAERQMSPPTAQQQAILPASQKAVLILADQHTIELDDLRKGVVAQEGETVIEKSGDGALSYQGKESTAALLNTLRTPRGGFYHVTLSDGTKVWLNAASSLRYPVSFGTAERRVLLTGQAYFEVAHDAKRPFRVVVNEQSQVEVLGTHFDISAYLDDNETKTTLLEGSVRVSPVPVSGVSSPLLSPGHIILQPGQQARFLVGQMTQQGIVVNKNVDTEAAISWMKGSFSYDKASFALVVRQLERWYDVDFVLPKHLAALPDRYTGDFQSSIPLSELLPQLSQITGLSFQLEGKKVIVRSK